MDCSLFFVKNFVNQGRFKICFAILILLSISGMAMGYAANYQNDLMFVGSAADNFLLPSTDCSVVRMLFCFLAVLIASSLCTGYGREDGLFPMLRMDRRRYIYGNAVLSAVMTAFAFAAALGINQLLCFAAFPLWGEDNRWGMAEYDLLQNVHPECLFDSWNVQNPYVYNLLYILIISILAGGIAFLTCGFGCTKLLGRLKPVKLSAVVFVSFMVLFLLSELLHIPAISILSYIEMGHAVSISGYIAFTGCIYGLGLFLIIRGRRTYEYI